MDRVDEKVGKFAHDMRADRRILVVAREADDGLLVRRHREMIRPEMDKPFGEGGRRRDCGAQARGACIDIMAADRRTQQAAEFGVHALLLRVHRQVGGFAAHRLAFVAIFDVSGGDRVASGQSRQRGWGGVIVADLARQPGFRLVDRRIVEPAA